MADWRSAARLLRIYFDKQLIASGHRQRLKAHIAWCHAKPGLHRVRVVATIWLLRHDEQIA